MRPMRSPLIAGPILALVAAGCTLAPLETPSPTPLPSASATPTPSAVPAPTATASGPAVPDQGSIPTFVGGERISTTIAGLRVRDQPGTDTRVITDLLPFDAELEVVMGPIVADDLGWYLVSDADAEAPDFEEGWVVAGFDPEASLRSTGQIADDSPVVISLAQVGDADFGPIDIPDERHIIRWVAADPEGVRCQFSIFLTAGSDAPIPAIRSPVSGAVIGGILQSSFFVGQPSLRGQLFLTAETDCAWTLAVMREGPPEPVPTP